MSRRRTVLGFECQVVESGMTIYVCSRPQLPFTGERLVIPGTCSPYFRVNDIIVGNMSTFPAAMPVPAEVFTVRELTPELVEGLKSHDHPVVIDSQSTQVGEVIGMAICAPGMDIGINVTNTSPLPVAFSAALIGYVPGWSIEPPKLLQRDPQGMKTKLPVAKVVGKRDPQGMKVVGKRDRVIHCQGDYWED